MRRFPTLAALAAALTLAVAAPTAAQSPVLGPDGGWLQYTTPGGGGFSAEALEDAYRLADSVGSAAVLIVRDARVVAAWGDVDRAFEAHSVRKSLVSALYGIAVGKGLVDLDATLAELGIDDRERLTASERQARVVDLLAARSGVYHPAAYSPDDMAESLPERGSHRPGTFWYYNNWDFNTAGEIFERETGLHVREAFERWIAGPIGMEDYDPDDGFDALEPSKSIHPAQTFRISARDLARFGQLYLQDGHWDDRQVVPAGWVERSTRLVSDIGGGQGYGYMWWVYPAGTISAEAYPNASRYDVVQARGTGGQALFVIPGAGTVIVHRADTDRGREVDGRAVWKMIDRILGAMAGEPAADAGLKPIEPRPLRGAMPAYEPPTLVSLDPGTIRALVGEYEIAPGAVARVFVHDGRPFAFMPGEGEAELFATEEGKITVRVVTGVEIEPVRNETGVVTGLVIRLGPEEIRAWRTGAEAGGTL